MYKKFFFILFIFYLSILELNANEKNFIIEKLISTNNLNFDFTQTSNEKTEKGNCTLVFNNKLHCKYNDEYQKEILIKEDSLIVTQKRYNKQFFYPLKNSPFIKILNKENLINIIKEANLNINERIELNYISESEITVYFNKSDYTLLGWQITDNFQNQINFFIKILSMNVMIDNNIFKTPRINQ